MAKVSNVAASTVQTICVIFFLTDLAICWAIEAVICAAEIQQAHVNCELVKLRMGIHVGDIVHRVRAWLYFTFCAQGPAGEA